MENLHMIGPAVDLVMLEKLERICRRKLPPDYVEFLTKTNGGKFESYQYVAAPGGDTVAVDWLAGLGEGALHDTFTWFENMNGRERELEIPPGYIPVAFTPGGDPFVISMVDEVPGVYFWDDQLFFKKSRMRTHAYFIAPTFSQFLELLRPTLEEAEADLAASDALVKPVGLVKPKKVKVIRPKFKGSLDAKLDQASQHFPELFHKGKCSNSLLAGEAGYELVASFEGWYDHAKRSMESRESDIKNHPQAGQCAESNPNALLLGAFLFGFVLGQADKEKITVMEFASSRNNIAEAIVRNQALLPS